jgi:hypothetical protein
VRRRSTQAGYSSSFFKQNTGSGLDQALTTCSRCLCGRLGWGFRRPDERRESGGQQAKRWQLPRISLRSSGLRAADPFQPCLLALAARCARVVAKPSAPKGRGECRVPSAPAASCAKSSGKCTRVFTAVAPEITRHSRTQWFYGLYVLSPEIGLSCLRRLRKLPSTDLTPASRRQDHTTWPSASVPLVRSTSASTASRPASVTIAIRPFRWDETGSDMEVIWVGMKAKIFFAMG